MILIKGGLAFIIMRFIYKNKPIYLHDQGDSDDSKHLQQKGEKLTCKLCNFKVAGKVFLNDHINGVHLGVKPHKCQKCDFTTAYSSAFYLHMKKIHVKCEKCTFTTYSKLRLKRHAKIHHVQKGNHVQGPERVADKHLQKLKKFN